MRRLIFSLILLLLFNPAIRPEAVCFAQTPDGSRSTSIDSIRVNQRTYPGSKAGDIVIGTKDSIIFYWSCKAGNGAKDRFLFRMKLKTDLDSANHVYNVTSLKYKNLPEQNYQFSVLAFDPQGKWITPPATVFFRVDNREKALISELDSLRRNVSAKDSSKIIFKAEKFVVKSSDLVLYVIGGILLVSLVFNVILFLRRRKRHAATEDLAGEPLGARPAHDDMVIKVSKFEYNRITTESGTLKGEIAALRGQIEALQLRGQDLMLQNRDLQDNVSKLSSSKSELEELQRQKDDLFAIIIHDIKNPASLIKSLVQLLRSYDLTATEQQEIIDDIVETSARIVSLSQEVSRILALESNRIILDMENVSIGEIIQDVARRNSIAAQNKKIVITVEPNDQLPLVQVDPQKIEEVLDNLLSNAIKFTQPGGQVLIRSYQDNGNALVDIRDNGLGLSEEDIRNAFQRGAVLSAKPTAGENSSGLGLWVVKKLVEAHKGRVTVKSALGKGSTFTFSVPFIHPPEEMQA